MTALNSALWWVRTRTDHTPAHAVASWNGRRATFMCGNEPAPGGQVITHAETERLQAHLCFGCCRAFGADVQTVYAPLLGGSR